MAFSDTYRRQVALLLRVLPIVAAEDCFALKGGTAINLFIRDMPRLSVDIDLTYLPTHFRTEALRAIDAAMSRIAQGIRGRIPGSRIMEVRLQPEEAITRLLVRANNAQIKIEVTPVLRGTVFPPNCGPCRRLSKPRSALPRLPRFPSPIFMLGKWSLRSTASIRAISLMSAICSPTKASTMRCVAPLSSTCSAIIAQWPKC
jgi:hypothetical protein